MRHIYKCNVCKVVHIIFFFHNQAKLSLIPSNLVRDWTNIVKVYPNVLFTKYEERKYAQIHKQDKGMFARAWTPIY